MNKTKKCAAFSMMLQSIILIVICCMCLIGSTFAWFTARISAEIETIGSSKIGFDIEVSEKISGTPIDVDNNILSAGSSYLIKLSLDNTSTAQKGYCVIEIENAEDSVFYYTPVFQRGDMEAYTVELVMGKEGCVNIEPSWGLHNKETCGSIINHFAYNISYDLDGGVLEFPNPTIYMDRNDIITLNNPTKEGCDFVGWIGSNGDEPQNTVVIEANSSGNKTYTAVWEEIHSNNSAQDNNNIN